MSRWLIFSPIRLTTASTPSKAASGGRSLAGSQACQETVGLVLPRPRRVAAEAGDLVAARQQRIADGRADQPGGAGDENSHRSPSTYPRVSPRAPYSIVEKVPVSSETRAIPSRRASSTTALATAGATSRSKTEGMM